eukprot:59731-Lingulodinium_polyedra.AAC.1
MATSLRAPPSEIDRAGHTLPTEPLAQLPQDPVLHQRIKTNHGQCRGHTSKLRSPLGPGLFQ